MNRRGGIWYFWKHPVQAIDFISTESSLFHSLITLAPNESKVLLTAMHAPSSSTSRPQFQIRLAQELLPLHTPWVVVGDLNTVTKEVEKKGGKPFRLTNCRAFLNFLDSSSLIDMGFSGPNFNWDNGRLGVHKGALGSGFGQPELVASSSPHPGNSSSPNVLGSLSASGEC